MNFSVNLTGKEPGISHPFSPPEIVTGTALIIILMVMAFLGNLLTCYVHCKKATLRTPTNISITMLAVSDILMAVLVMPLSLVSFIRGKWPFSLAACTFNAFLFQALLAVTFVTMGFTAVIRYLCVVKPSLHSHLKQRCTCITIFAAWMMYLVIFTVTILVNGGIGFYSESRAYCSLKYKHIIGGEQTDRARISLAGVAVTAILVAYYRIFRFVSHHNQAVLPNLQQGNNLNIEEVKITRTLVFVVLGFALCWAPVSTIEILSTLMKTTSKMPKPVLFYQTIFIFAASAINPLIYGSTNRRFRNEYVEILSRLWLLRSQVAPS